MNAAQVTAAEWRHSVALISSRALSLEAPNGNRVKYLVPLVDMANHQERSPHQVRVGGAGAASTAPAAPRVPCLRVCV